MKQYILNVLITICLFCAFILTAFTAGYTAERYRIKQERCINSACDQPCGKKFQRHAGCVNDPHAPN